MSASRENRHAELLGKLQALPHYGESNGWIKIDCPAHSDGTRTHSGGWIQNEDGGLGVKCHTGCSTESILSSLGHFNTRDLFPPRTNGHRNHRPKPKKSSRRKSDQRSAKKDRHKPLGEAVARYFYVNQYETVLYAKIRYEPKDFRLKHRDGLMWKWNLPKEVPHVLYNLPNVLDAKNKGERIFWVEGEKDADNLIRLGLCATTNVEGAGPGKWKPEYSKMLHEGRIVIIPDQDEPGIAFGQEVAAALHKPARSVRVLDLPEGKDVTDWIENHGGTKGKLLELAGAAPHWKPHTETQPDDNEAESAEPEPADERPIIMVSENEYETNRAAIKVLRNVPGLYQRAGMLCHIVRDRGPELDWIERPRAPRIEQIPPAILREYLTEQAVFAGLNAKGIVKQCHPPGWCISALAERHYWKGVRHLQGVIEFPIFKMNGEILAKSGYDADTCLRLEWNGKRLPIPERPKRKDALAARDLLLSIVVDFPFAEPCYRSAWLALPLTIVSRYGFRGPSPFFIGEGNVRGVGKGLMMQAGTTCITGERLATATYTDSEVELEKRITSIAMAGDRAVLWDNVTGTLGNGILNAALTSTSWHSRILGGNKIYNGPLLTIWTATANNPSIDDETLRRCCPIRLQSALEQPELREGFEHSPLLPYVRSRHREFLAAALTILSAYHRDGRPKLGLPAWGTFDEWSDLVRSAIVWLELPDPGEGRYEIEGADPGGMSVVLAGIKHIQNAEVKPDRGVTCSRILERIESSSIDERSPRRALRDALIELVPNLDAPGLGYLLRRYCKRNIGGWFVDQRKIKGKPARWIVRSAEDMR
jgi:hypothetical protein